MTIVSEGVRTTGCQLNNIHLYRFEQSYAPTRAARDGNISIQQHYGMFLSWKRGTHAFVYFRQQGFKAGLGRVSSIAGALFNARDQRPDGSSNRRQSLSPHPIASAYSARFVRL